jgi:chromatin remodeling complex protein RSC6
MSEENERRRVETGDKGNRGKRRTRGNEEKERNEEKRGETMGNKEEIKKGDEKRPGKNTFIFISDQLLPCSYKEPTFRAITPSPSLFRIKSSIAVRWKASLHRNLDATI